MLVHAGLFIGQAKIELVQSKIDGSMLFSSAKLIFELAHVVLR
jgi:hypothetical protein